MSKTGLLGRESSRLNVVLGLPLLALLLPKECMGDRIVGTAFNRSPYFQRPATQAQALLLR